MKFLSKRSYWICNIFLNISSFLFSFSFFYCALAFPYNNMSFSSFFPPSRFFHSQPPFNLPSHLPIPPPRLFLPFVLTARPPFSSSTARFFPSSLFTFTFSLISDTSLYVLSSKNVRFDIFSMFAFITWVWRLQQKDFNTSKMYDNIIEWSNDNNNYYRKPTYDWRKHTGQININEVKRKEWIEDETSNKSRKRRKKRELLKKYFLPLSIG